MSESDKTLRERLLNMETLNVDAKRKRVERQVRAMLDTRLTVTGESASRSWPWSAY